MAKTVRFLKDHLRHKKGEKASIIDAAANYFIKCGVAVEVKTVEPSNITISPKRPNTSESARGRKKK